MFNPKLHNEVDKYRKETNSIFYSLSRQLITLSVITITLSPPFLAERLAGHYILTEIYLAAVAIALISAFSGIALFYKDYEAFKQYTMFGAVLAYKDEANRTVKEKKLVEKYSEASSGFDTGQRWLYAQIISTLISLSLLFLVVMLLLTS